MPDLGAQVWTGTPVPRSVPSPRGTAPLDFYLPRSLLMDALSSLVGSDTGSAVAEACLPLLIAQPGVRGCALAVRSGRQALLVGSAGYECGSMAVGATLPLDAGLPVTEAVRSGRLVVRGSGPSWVAVPFGARHPGALLLCLTGAPPQSPDVLARLQRLSRAAGDALHRVVRLEEAVLGMAVVHERLGAVPAAPVSADLAVRVLPHEGAVGGDLALCLPAPGGGRWLVLADVCGAGLGAALVAGSVRTAVYAVAPFARGPGEMLSAVEAAVAANVPAGSFVTAVVGHLDGRRLDVASAGHPAPVLVTPHGVEPLVLEAGQPLALETGSAASRPVLRRDLPAGSIVLLHSDGLTDRRAGSGSHVVDVSELLPAGWDGTVEGLADATLEAALAAGPAGDDVSLLLVRVGT